MKLTLQKEHLDPNSGGGLEIAVSGFAGDSGAQPVQIFVEWYGGKLAVHVWDGTSSNANTHIIKPLGEETRRCPSCLDVPGKDGLGRTCKTCGGSGEVKA